MNARADLPALDAIRAIEPEMLATRHQIHANPELAFEEFQTSDLVAERLTRWGYAVHRGLGGTGVVGTLKVGDGKQRLGLRADMDALPIEEAGLSRPWASRVLGKMHACGHDGHTAMLLGRPATWLPRRPSMAPCTWCSSPPRRAWAARG